MKPFWRRWLPRCEWDEELESHVAMRSEWNQHDMGLTPEQSATLARRQFGNKLRTREAIEDLYPARLLADFAQDLRHTLRLFRSSPGFVLTVVGTIAAGIAAAATIFSIVDPLLFRELPFKHANELVSVGVYGPIDTNEFVVGAMYLEWRDRQTVFTSLTAMRPGIECDLEAAQTDRVPCVAIEQNFLPTLGVNPIVGRNFTRAEDQPNAPRTLLISTRLWRERFGSRPDIAGHLIKLDGALVRIVGVLPAGFMLPQGADVDVLLPAQLDPRQLADPHGTVFLRAFARLKPGISLTEAQARMAPLFRDTIQRTVPPELRREVRPGIRSVRDRIVQQAKLASHMLLGAVALLLVMACLTVTNLLLARAHATRGELAMRAALGAGRSRLVRQRLTESILLALCGGAGGFALSALFVRLLVAAAPGGFLQVDKAHVDLRALTFSGCVTLAVAVLSGLLPALWPPDASVVRTWRLTGSRTAHLRQAVTSLQLACSLILLAGALLFGRSLTRLESQQPGFSPSSVMTVSLRLSRPRYSNPAVLRAFYRELETKLKHLPGVQAVAVSDSMPPAGSVRGRPLANIRVAGRTPSHGEGGMVDFRFVTPGYFETLGIPVLRGRTFSEAERNQPESALIISETLSRHLFPASDPLGQRVSLDDRQHWLTVIGVVANVKNNGITVPASPEYYRLHTESDTEPGLTGIVLARSSLDSRALVHWLTQQIAALDPAAATQFEPMPERLDRLNDRPRFLAFVLLIFALVGVLLAGTGLYGVITFLVGGRTREIGIRAALGATRRDIVLLVQRQMLSWAVAGLAIGLIGSLALTGLVRGLLFEISPRDPVLLACAAACLFAVALAAAWKPCWTAAHVDPAQTLRSE